MQAAGSSLDDANYNGQTYRDTGVAIILQIVYDNFVNWKGVQNIYYYYQPVISSGSSYKYYDPEYSNYRTVRKLVNIHGAFIEAVKLGNWGRSKGLISMTC